MGGGRDGGGRGGRRQSPRSGHRRRRPRAGGRCRDAPPPAREASQELRWASGLEALAKAHTALLRLRAPSAPVDALQGVAAATVVSETASLANLPQVRGLPRPCPLRLCRWPTLSRLGGCPRLTRGAACAQVERMQRVADLLRVVQGQCHEARAEMERRRGGRDAASQRSRSASADGRTTDGGSSA